MVSENTKITKEVEITIQVDYVECERCGKHLDFTLESDNYGDLQISVAPHSCNEEN